MINKCLACGIEKDPELYEKYPYPEDMITTSWPIEPFIELDCEPSDKVHGVFKRVSVCHECFHKLDPDMWISQGMWEDLNPVIPFNRLPRLI